MAHAVFGMNIQGDKPHTSLYQRAGKRLIDVIVSAGALFILLPLFGVIAVLIKLNSPGRIFYLQERVGRCGRYFQIIKFRSMCTNAEKLGPGITTSGDSRITPIGKFLRKFKLDEIPQFWNVLKGDMSLIGPRPELPSYVDIYTAEQARVLNVRPGITDPASIVYRHEEKILASAANPEEFYKTVLLPHKLTLNLQYIEKLSLYGDLLITAETIIAIFSPRSANHSHASGERLAE